MEAEMHFHIMNDDDSDDEYFVGLVDDFYHPEAVVPDEAHLHEVYEIERDGYASMVVNVYWIGELPDFEVRETVINHLLEEIVTMFDGPPGNYRWN